MNVIDRSLDGLWRENISIETRPFLPKSETFLAGAFLYSQLVEQVRPLFGEGRLDLLGNRPFHIRQIPTEIRFRGLGPNQQMNVLGHKDERNQIKLLGGPGGVDSPCQSLAPNVICQQRHSLITRERQFMEVARLMVVL